MPAVRIVGESQRGNRRILSLSADHCSHEYTIRRRFSHGKRKLQNGNLYMISYHLMTAGTLKSLAVDANKRRCTTINRGFLGLWRWRWRCGCDNNQSNGDNLALLVCPSLADFELPCARRMS